MRNSTLSSLLTQHVHSASVTAAWQAALSSSSEHELVETAASYGRWWHNTQTGDWILSGGAATLLHIAPGWYPSMENCFGQVLLDDINLMKNLLSSYPDTTKKNSIDFRCINEINGLRWLQMQALSATTYADDAHAPQATPCTTLLTGILLDITTAKHAEIREKLSFESTQHLVGTDTLQEAITNVIQLVCENLGWDWGGYWSMDSVPVAGTNVAHAHTTSSYLTCTCFWQNDHNESSTLSIFTQDSKSLQMIAGQGLIGQTWETGKAHWIDDVTNEPRFLRSSSAKAAKLKSGFMFPVFYDGDDGHRHSPGVLEFYSCLSRQSEAQLPILAVSIGTLIAQTALRHERQETIRRLAQIDELTGLANRGHFYHMLDLACEQAITHQRTFGLMFIDLDRFKPVNDAYGHEAGNVVLRQFSQRLQALATSECHVGRLGGDEFAILLSPQDSSSSLTNQLDTMARKALEAARLPFLFEQHEMTVSASIGISIFPENGSTSPELLSSADAAMYRIKKNGRNALSFFSDSTSNTLAEQQSDLAIQLTIERELHQALADGDQFYLEYQPIFDQTGHHLHAVEALIRWRHPTRGIVPPDVFIPLAEKSHLIIHIGRWVMQQACHDLAQLHKAGLYPLQVHVNMAAPEFASEKLTEHIMSLIASSGIAPADLCLELTESMLMQQPDTVIPIMHALRKLGIGISLDDFGMGYSSLSLLKNLPISSMKIDRSFVHGLPHQEEDCAIAHTIIELGRKLHLGVIAEGVETIEQLDFLRQHGYAQLQGYVLSRPIPITTLIALFAYH